MRAFIVVAVIAAIALADSEISLNLIAGENLTDAEASFSYRWQTAQMHEFLLPSVIFHLPSAAYFWSSVSVNVKAADKKALADANAMFSVAFPPTDMVHPFALLAYGTGEAAASLDALNFAAAAISGTSSFTGGMVAMAALTLSEYTPDNQLVKNTVIPLRSNSCSPKEMENGDVKGMTCSMTFSSNPVKITVSYVTSKIAGIMQYGQTPVSPRSIDMIIEAKNFKLTDPKNHARLDIGLMTASGAGEAKGNARVINKDSESVYVAVSGYAVVNGKRTEVDVNIKSGENDLDKESNAFLKLALGASMDFQIAHIDFPAGASDFVYDPAAGSGSVVYEAGASAVALSALVALVCALLFLF